MNPNSTKIQTTPAAIQWTTCPRCKGRARRVHNAVAFKCRCGWIAPVLKMEGAPLQEWKMWSQPTKPLEVKEA